MNNSNEFTDKVATQPTKAELMSEENGLSEEINQAYIDNVGYEYATAEDCSEAYQGRYNTDEEFVQQLLEDTTEGLKDLPNYIYIDWGRTAQDVMYDYFESDGYYFRNL